jgi:hypothetical protein
MSIYLPDRSVIVDAMNGRRNRRELLADHSPPPESRMKEKREIPKFKSEADEAAWWYAHREETARWMEEAAVNGPNHYAFRSVAARTAAGAFESKR